MNANESNEMEDFSVLCFRIGAHFDWIESIKWDAKVCGHRRIEDGTRWDGNISQGSEKVPSSVLLCSAALPFYGNIVSVCLAKQFPFIQIRRYREIGANPFRALAAEGWERWEWFSLTAAGLTLFFSCAPLLRLPFFYVFRLVQKLGALNSRDRSDRAWNCIRSCTSHLLAAVGLAVPLSRQNWLKWNSSRTQTHSGEERKWFNFDFK